jgi:hypothetical protein
MTNSARCRVASPAAAPSDQACRDLVLARGRAVCGFLEGILGTVGPLMAPFFLAYGLMRNAYIGTDALATVAMQGTKLAVFGSAQVLHRGLIVAGLTLIRQRGVRCLGIHPSILIS